MTLVERYAGAVSDLDGVLVLIDTPVTGAAETVAELQRRGFPFLVATNNSSRTPAQVAALLGDAGVPVRASQVVTSSQAAAAMLEPGTSCLVIGSDGLLEALAERGCDQVTEPDAADAVVVGWDRDLVWDDLRRATLAVARGARFIGTNGDVSYPAPEGPWPGNGATLAAIAVASGREPEIAGKPQAAMFRAAATRLPDGPLLMVGDRHETDVVGAAAVGWDTALVLSGVTPRASIGRLDPQPTWVLDDVRGLL